MQQLDLRDMPWISVSDHDGHRRMVGLRELLTDAHQLRDIHDDDPTVLMGLHRFLPTVLALVCARYDWRDRTHSWVRVAEAGLDAAHVTAALDELGDALVLNGTFMQDSQVSGTVRPIAELHPLAPTAATKAWWRREVPATFTSDIVARHLVAAWFSNTAAAGRASGEYLDEPGIGYRPRGNPAAAISAIRAFGVGDTLLRSLLSRVQRDWLKGTPLWAAPGAMPGRDALADATWTGDALRLIFEDGACTGFVRAGRRVGDPSTAETGRRVGDPSTAETGRRVGDPSTAETGRRVGDPSTAETGRRVVDPGTAETGRRVGGDPKALERALWQADPHILRRQPKGESTGTPFRVSLRNLPAGAATLQYVGELFTATAKAEAVNPLSGLITPRRFIYHLHRVEGSPMAPEITQSAFLGLDEQLLGPDARARLTSIATKVAGPVQTAFWVAATTAVGKGQATPVLTGAYREFAHGTEDLLAELLEDRLALGDAITAYLARAEQAFQTASAPYRTPSLAAAFASADGKLRALLNRVSPASAPRVLAGDDDPHRKLVTWAFGVRSGSPSRAATVARLAHAQHQDVIDVGLQKLLSALPEHERPGALRAVGVTVGLRQIPNSYRRVGEALSSLGDSSMTQLLTALVTSDLGTATRVLNHHLARVEGVSFFDLAELLCAWDTGDPVARCQHRTRLLTDFHAPRPERTRP